MATNGESAARWLQEQGAQASPERLGQIRDNLAKKLEELDAEHPEYPGLLEALDVMDNYIAGVQPSTSANEAETPALDLSPLVADAPTAAPISADERRARFARLLSEGRLPPEID